MQVFKFGGASVKDADAVRNVGNILKMHDGQSILVVISAMGKTTNNLEELATSYVAQDGRTKEIFNDVKKFHDRITNELIGNSMDHFYEVDNLFVELECLLDTPPSEGEYDFYYDQIVAFGELISTRITSHYLNTVGISARWLDSRNFIMTSDDHRRGKVDWEITTDLISKRVKLLASRQIVVTQGFIGRSKNLGTVTLGREGSDYSAAIFAYGLDAESVTIWKDVDGVMNGDPKKIQDTTLLKKISFKEAIELAYYGATVIHPKTIQPLRRKGIPLFVRSFVDTNKEGTEVQAFNGSNVIEVPCYIFKANQVLMSLRTRDFSFIVEDNLSSIFSIFARHNIQISLMQNSAISFRVCATVEDRILKNVVAELEEIFDLKIQKNLELKTIFNFDLEKSANDYASGKKILMEQRTERVLQLVLED